MNPAQGNPEKATHLAEKPRDAYTSRTAPLRFVGVACCVIIAGVPAAQIAYELAKHGPIQALDYLDPFARGMAGRGAVQFAGDLVDDIVSEPRLRRFETALHDQSLVTRELLPWYQWAVTTTFGHGNEKSVTGLDGWLFFADDLKSAFGKGYLEPGVGGQQALAAIEDFRRQLDERGIELLLIPSYSKELLDAEMLSRSSKGLLAAPNPDLEKCYAELDARGLAYVRMDELFAQCRADQGDPAAKLALPRDSHWAPATMAFCAEQIAARVRDLLLESPTTNAKYRKRPQAIQGQGDLLRMLGLPASQTIYPLMELTIEQVVDSAGELVRPDPKSDVLLMGDSLTKVFSDPTLLLGEGAGLAEHLALHLDRALDVIAIAGGSATAARESLARRSGDGLAGKRLVLWQFGVRMLASGPKEWKLVQLPEPDAAEVDPTAGTTRSALPVLGQAVGTKGKTTNQIRTPGYEPPPEIPTDRVRLIGEIVAVSPIPPDFDYEFTLCIHELKVLQIVEGELPAKLKGNKVWVGFPARVDGEDTATATWAPGLRLELVLEDYRLRFDENVSWQMSMNAGKVIHYPLTWREVGE
ncbi:MAG: hypothetical protein EXS13_03580 [Planctomycetes bacterium]|nr:hypothetical protein [Planctomycetota bacterium]